MNRLRNMWWACLVSILAVASARGAELVRLTAENWDKYAPRGKEVDCIYGDYVLKNDKIVCVIANPVPTRHANMTVRDVGGAIIDLTRVDRPNDQLSCYYPEARRFSFRFGQASAGNDRGDRRIRHSVQKDGTDAHIQCSGQFVQLTCIADATAGKPAVVLTYKLSDGEAAVEISTQYKNPHDKLIEVQLGDSMRADRSFDKGPSGEPWFWVYDAYWRQAYGVLCTMEGMKLKTGTDASSRSAIAIRFCFDEDKNTMPIEPGKEFIDHGRYVFPASDLFQVRELTNVVAGVEQREVEIAVHDKAGRSIADAKITLLSDDKPYGEGYAGESGKLAFLAPKAKYRLRVSSLGRESKSLDIDTAKEDDIRVELVDPGYVVAKIVAESGGPIPCKVQFRGKGETEDPLFGPDTAEHAVHNLYYSHNGQFRQAMQPGTYDVTVSYGPEYDAVFATLEVRRGEETPLAAKLVRSVKTPGWISADFHNHASPSGDNTASQFGRVLNLLCEHLEYAPCTEHNRIDSYVPHLKRLGVEHLMGTCTGIELTGQPLPLNHQNAFPLVLKPGAQDGGGPTADIDPAVQIARLALWDNRSEKLVQQNHPDLGNLFFDKNGDGVPDEGFKDAFPHMDVMEVHPLDELFQPPVIERGGKPQNNTILNWLQLLNQGHRIPGVVNTDAHYNFHGSGFQRNYIKSPTDDPAKIQTLDIVRASERGNVIMTTGPYLEVSLRSGDRTATAGEDLAASDGAVTLAVRVQCPNWFDIDRVQVFLNGRADGKLNFTREANSERFGSGVVKFEQELRLTLSGDTHVAVATLGEKTTLGHVMGPTYGKWQPIAVSNPVFVDVDGGGFKPNGDTLGFPLPVKAGTAAKKK